MRWRQTRTQARRRRRRRETARLDEGLSLCLFLVNGPGRRDWMRSAGGVAFGDWVTRGRKASRSPMGPGAARSGQNAFRLGWNWAGLGWGGG